MGFYEKGPVRIHYQEAGSGFPLCVIPGGGQNSTIGFMSDRAPFNAIEEFVPQPVGFRKASNPMYDNSMQTWGPALVKQRLDLTMDMIDKFLTRMYVTNADFVFSLPRDVVQGCPVPVLVMPDETPSHPYEPAIESAMLAPKSELTFFPWKDTKEKIPLAVRHVRSFLKANRPA